ncbi:hypothetical protein K8640_36090 [Myxococcus sp. XM-1-1-1]|uniref:hypothetical protein n=1 Tax=Myxococcus sp. XM-1-1-1 TaxID=2874602 RepID=UPI001CC1096C|nr:hypothetical protein [Myxococcus sp. XM-1-1-1]MBZ4413660.1 hypothetical protein [Myxococcus sp. XM-1-1-1]
MLELELNPRLEQIRHQGFREEAENVLRSGELRKLIRLIGPVPGDSRERNIPVFEPAVDLAEVERETRFIRQEALARGLDMDEEFIQTMTYMRHITIPIQDPRLRRAISRVWSLVLWFDPDKEYNPEKHFLSLKHASAVAHPPSALMDYVDFSFEELGHSCDSDFLGLYKNLFFQYHLGTLLEVLVARHGAQRTTHSVRYIRDHNGSSEFWYLSLQFIDARLSFARDPLFWVDTLEAARDFIAFTNDVFSFYKEAKSQLDFENCYLFKQSQTQKRPYLEVYRETLATTVRNYHAILESASSRAPELRAHVEHYLKSFIYWHFRSRRYLLQEVYPELRYWEDRLSPPLTRAGGLTQPPPHLIALNPG